MKSTFYLKLILLFTFNMANSQNADDCKVLHEELKGSYVGQCQNGLANGKGEFTFSDGKFIYQGIFKNGKMNGEGKIFSVLNNTKKVVSKGFWEDNVYVGDKSVPYEVKRTINLDRYTVNKRGDDNIVHINFYQNGGRNNVSKLNISVNNGNRIQGSYTESYENIVFPFKCQMTYDTKSKFKASSYTVEFEIVINEPGTWDITLYN